MDSIDLSSPEDSPTMLSPDFGRFAWAVVGVTCVPCLLREDDIKYVPNRLVETEIQTQFEEKLKIHAFNWLHVETSFITKAESALLNHINRNHCELIFGEAEFTESDTAVKLDDLIQYYNFLDLSYNMLLSERSNRARPFRCGFVRINEDNDSIIPYVMKNEQKYLPIFYFDGETKCLEAEAIALEKWDLAYLKLCCRAQGIRNDLIAGDKCYVSSLEQIKLFFAEDTKFDDFWPAKAIQSLQSLSLAEEGNRLRGPTASAGTARDEVRNQFQGPAAPTGTARAQQSTSRVEVQNQFQRPAPTGAARAQQSTSRVEVQNRFQRPAAPASAARAQQSTSRVEIQNRFQGPAPTGAARAQQSTSRVEVQNRFQRPAAPASAARVQQSTSRVEVQNRFQRPAAPASATNTRPSLSRVETNSSHLRGQAPPAAISGTAPPPYPSAVSNNRQHSWNRPSQPSVSQRTNSSVPTMNRSSNASFYQDQSRSAAAMTNSTPSFPQFPHPISSMQSMGYPYTAQRNNFDPRQRKQ